MTKIHYGSGLEKCLSIAFKEGLKKEVEERWNRQKTLKEMNDNGSRCPNL